ncbi:MAG: ABC transporter ATP-binding protein [Saccharolobus sp.]
MKDVKVEVLDVWKRFRKEDVLCGVTFKVFRGEVYTIMGPNGSGKSTLMSIITGVVKPTKGHVLIDGHDIGINKINVSYMPQRDSVSYYLTAEENMHFYGRLYGLSKNEIVEKTKILLDQVGLTEHKGKLVKYYSGGMVRKLELAIALLPNSSLLILDEPTHGLDPLARLELWKIIENLKYHNTMILATHIAEDAEAISNKVAFINKGKIVAEGTPDEIKAACSNAYAVVELRMPKSIGSKEKIKQYSKGGFVIETELGYKIYPKMEPGELDRVLSKLNLKVYDVISIPPTLEDAFLLIVGTSLRNSV